MSIFQVLVAVLLLSHVGVAAIAWWLCQRQSRRKIAQIQAECDAVSARARQSLAQMHAARAEFDKIAADLIAAQVLVELAHEQMEQPQQP